MTQARSNADYVVLPDPVQAAIDTLPPSTWDAAVWLPTSDYVMGRIDPTDVKRIVAAVLAAAQGCTSAQAVVSLHFGGRHICGESVIVGPRTTDQALCTLPKGHGGDQHDPNALRQSDGVAW